jgi:glycerophosphoryl diester phosphodiesterase
VKIRQRYEHLFPLVAAHRGASRTAPENTLPAFEQALAQGAAALELDVQMTADHRIVVIHDRTLERTTSGTGRVEHTTWSRLRLLDAGSWFSGAYAGTRVPLLGDVLDLARGRAFVNIELKPSSLTDVGFESRVVDLVRAHGMEQQVLFMSFDHVAVERIKLVAPDIPGLVICGCRLAQELNYLRNIGADGSNQGMDRWPDWLISFYREEGFITHASLLNDLEAVHQVTKRGVDMLDSDEPRIWGSVERSARSR